MSSRSATIVADLGFGDSGKGSIIDYLARISANPTVIRFNGGAQAAHNVVTADGRHHTFSQFGSGTFVPGVSTHLSRFMLFDPIALAEEAQRLYAVGISNALPRLTIDRDALVVTPFHKAANRIRERLRGASEHGTCGMGIGETMADSLSHGDSIHARDLQDERTLANRFAAIQERKRAEFQEHGKVIHGLSLGEDLAILEDASFAASVAEKIAGFSKRLQIVSGEILRTFSRTGDLLFEGAQGVLLDEWYGFHPHTTWSTTTFANAEALLSSAEYAEPVKRLGVLRAYHTRHGAGPFPTYDRELSRLIPDSHNGSKGWQGEFRVGWLDLVLARYALSVCGGAHELAITNLDRIMSLPSLKACTAYQVPAGSIERSLPVKEAIEDLAYQENLTRYLDEAKPVYEPASTDSQQYLRMISDHVAVPVRIASYGPTADDKRIVNIHT